MISFLLNKEVWWPVKLILIAILIALVVFAWPAVLFFGALALVEGRGFGSNDRETNKRGV